MSSHALTAAARLGCALLGCVLLLAPIAPAAQEEAGPPAVVDPLDRVQLHRNPNRSVPYLPLAGAAEVGEAGAAGPLVMKPLLTIELDGGPLQNVYGNLRPIDVDGTGRFEFVHYNGFRFMQVWNAAARRLWRIEDPAGRLHDYAAGTARDTISVLDLDHDGEQDIAHCWTVAGKRSLVFRRGRDGTVIRSVALEGSPAQECHLAAFRAGPARQPLLLVSHTIGTARKGCQHNWIGYWARVVAFDLQQKKLWERDTCDAGHYAWPLDEDQDGAVEAIFVGKYLLRPDGSLQCKLGGWPEDDHVDGMALADLDPDEPGLEAVAVGRTGTALFRAATCEPLWRIPANIIRDPQHVALARIDPASPRPLIAVDERGTVRGNKTFLIDGSGKIVLATTNSFMPMQNANLDGANGTDELVGSFGKVIDRQGITRLDRSWYWALKGGRTNETSRGPYPLTYDRWQAFPLVFDYDGDGRDEIVTWGQSLIVVGKVVAGTTPQPQIKVREASYGTATRQCDAKPVVARRCDGRLSCSIIANAMLCGDPQPGTPKTLTIDYACGTALKSITVRQNAAAPLSCMLR